MKAVLPNLEWFKQQVALLVEIWLINTKKTLGFVNWQCVYKYFIKSVDDYENTDQ